MKSKRKNITTNSQEDKIKRYRSQIRKLVKEFNWVDEPTQAEFDFAIHALAKRIYKAKQKFNFSQN